MPIRDWEKKVTGHAVEKEALVARIFSASGELMPLFSWPVLIKRNNWFGKHIKNDQKNAKYG